MSRALPEQRLCGMQGKVLLRSAKAGHDEMDEMKPLGKTAQAIADTFLELVMERGYNAVSYADLANRLGIRTASIHYHFPSKSDLGLAVLQRYVDGAFNASNSLSPERPQSYHEAFEGMLVPVRAMADKHAASCLIGVLSAEFSSLPDPLKEGVRHFLDEQQNFLTQLLEGGRKAGVFSFPGEAHAMAKMIASTLQGGILIKKAREDWAYMESVLQSLTDMVIPPPKDH
jgi:TetR/AcrR family transcriptional regulator, transcriptional repressor for nem operon